MKKHKMQSMVAVLALAAFCLSGCAATAVTESSTETQPASQAEPAPDNAGTASAEQSKEKPTDVPEGESNVLVVYFSHTGNTQKLAEAIHEQVGGDLRRIETVEPYPEGDAIYDVSEKEASEDARPAYKDLDINLDDYDKIFIGYPIWAYNMPQVLYSFFDDYDLSGKVVIPFNTHNGAKDAGTYSKIQQLEPNATILEGLPMMGDSMDEDQSEAIKAWLERIL